MSKISVIIPVYNVENYLRQALDSVVNQTLKDIEIICVNDCSPDNSLEILCEYAQKDSRIKIIDLKENKGQGNARNIAIQEVNGDYIMFLDPDDWYELDTCEKAYNQIAKNNNDFVIFDLSRFWEEAQLKILDDCYSKSFVSLYDKSSINPQKCDFQFFHNAFSVNKIYKTSFLLENNILFSDGRFLEDLKFTTMVFCNSINFSFIGETLYNYRKKANETMTLDYTMYYSHIINSHKENYLYVLGFCNENLIRNYLMYTIKSTLHWFKKFTSINPSIIYDFYTMLHSYYVFLDESYNIDEISSKIDYKKFKYILKNKSASKYMLIEHFKNVLKLIFSIRNSADCKVLTILGVKFNLKFKVKGN